jgi:NADH-quinone oxidoreductase subunit N
MEKCIPEFFLIFSLCALFLYGSFLMTSSTSSEKTLKSVHGNPMLGSPILWLSIQSLFIGSLLSFNNTFSNGPFLTGSLYHDNLTATGKILLFLFGAMCLISSQRALRTYGLNAWEYSLIVVLAVVAMGLLLSAYDLIALYLALELQSLGLYVLATFNRGSAYSTEAGLKYFIVGAFSSGLLLFGGTLLYGYSGITNLEDLGRLALAVESLDSSAVIGLVFLSAGLLFKIAAAPFHMWSPDVYEGSPTSSTIIFAVLPKLAFFGLLLRVYYLTFYDFMSIWQTLLLCSSLVSMVVAALGALYQRRVKRFLAYSSIGHVAYLLLALSCGTEEGIKGLLLYTLIYMVMSLNVWTILLTCNVRPSITGKTRPLIYLDELSGLSRVNPWLAGTLAVVVFSLAGIPPMAGFFAKLYVFMAAMEGSLYTVAIIGVLTSVISAFYYLRWVKIIYFEENTKKAVSEELPEVTLDRSQALLLACSTGILLGFWVYPNPFLVLSHQMALSICI